MTPEKRRLLKRFTIALAAYVVGSIVGGAVLLPSLLFYPPVPRRTADDLARYRALSSTSSSPVKVRGGEGVDLDLIWRRRAGSKATLVLLHGFGDDGWGTFLGASGIPEVDLVGFTFRGRDRDPSTPCTLGGWERSDVVAVVKYLESQGVPRSRIVLKGASQGAGVALLALEDLEKEGGPLGGALLESPFRDLRSASQHWVGKILGPPTVLLYPAIEVGLWWGGHRAHFDPESVSPLNASRGRTTPIALVSGTADRQTTIDGVREIAANIPDFIEVEGAAHMEAAGRLPGGDTGWSTSRLVRWGLLEPRR
jgi:hypothetical protein